MQTLYNSGKSRGAKRVPWNPPFGGTFPLLILLAGRALTSFR